MLITNMTGNLNLKACAQQRYNPIYLDTFIFPAILYLDYNRVFDSHVIGGMYIYMVVQRITLYMLFLNSIITQLCDYLDIPFIQVKQNYVKRNN